MFSAVLFAENRGVARAIEMAAQESREVCIYKTLNVLPSAYELTRLLNAFRPDIIFVDLSRLEGGMVIAKGARVILPDAAIIGFSEKVSEWHLAQVRKAGVLEVLCLPLTNQKFQQSLERAMRQARPAVEENLLAFLPAKAGSGATTIALNVAGCLANDLNQKVLLMEADLRSGLLGVLLKLQPQYSILNALENAALLDGTLWSQIVSRAHGLDLLVSPRPEEASRVSWAGYHRLLQFLRVRYDAIVADLPEVVNDATGEIVLRAKGTYIVATPELPALVLAKQRRKELVKRGIPDERIGVILNRWRKEEINVRDIEEFLDRPVSFVFQNDYHSVRRAMQEGRLISKKSELGRLFSAFARKLAESEVPDPEPAQGSRSFLDSVLRK
ncbi:MAG: hypothetical protein HY238_20585 [Acidobacteria bacterium]|nr:hypothetical protein [Acidobacteriota bacterium]